MYQNAALFFKKKTIQFSKTQFDFQKYNSISEIQFNLKTQFNFTTTTFIPHSLITQFNFQKHSDFQKHNSVSKTLRFLKAQFSFKNTIQFHDHSIHSTFTENTNSHDNTFENLACVCTRAGKLPAPDVHDSLSRGYTVFSPVTRSHHRDYSQRSDVFKMWHDPWRRLQFLHKNVVLHSGKQT